ncbi:hypothetical protein CVT24_007680 [Panaeolus cyanescens]|uniref:Tyrosine specific protein phosphatases domain-containing protein n=1 Tax=Panaeolus cyanescens TaxID=181874 RepID=A0A409VRH7_9AGAR|nr:hypothetical protein CVT24_007680 [Panaeolus cyanescens]
MFDFRNLILNVLSSLYRLFLPKWAPLLQPKPGSTLDVLQHQSSMHNGRTLSSIPCPPSNSQSPNGRSAKIRKQRPIPNSYWATNLLLACEYPWTPKNPDNPKVDNLLRAGVRTFIDLTESGELVPYNCILAERCALLGIDPSTIEYHRFPIRDRCLPESVSYMYQVLNTLQDNQDRGRISAVHCRGGIGRTGMVIGCWLVESGVAKNGEDALSMIAREWKTVEKCTRYPHSPETGAQFDFVFQFLPSTLLDNSSPTVKLSRKA